MSNLIDWFNHRYPYTNMHELNLDWIINEVMRCIKGFEDAGRHFETLDEAISEIISKLEDFSKSDVFIEKVKEALQIMYDDGRLEELMRNIVDVNVWNTEYTLFGRVPSPNGFFSGRLYSWVNSAIESLSFKDVIKIGANVFKNCVNGLSDCIGIGTGVMSENQVGTHNIGIGMFALSHLKGIGDSSGTRNIGIGSYAFLFAQNLKHSIGIGRDVGQNVVTGDYNTLVGYGAMGGYAHVGLDGNIVNGAEIEAIKTTTLGSSALVNTNDVSNTIAIGTYCASNVKNSANNVVIGDSAVIQNGSDISLHGKTLVSANDIGTYTVRDNDIIVTIPHNQAVSGNYVRIKFTSGKLSENTNEEQLLYVSQNGDPEFTLITNYDNIYGNGNCIVTYYELNTPNDYEFEENLLIGSRVAENTVRMVRSTCIGSSALRNTPTVKYSTTVGRNIGYNKLIECEGLTAVGASSANEIEHSYHDTLIGMNTGNAFKSSNGNTCVGYGAGNLMVDGTGGANVTNSTLLGYASRCSGDNEVCLGGYGTTPYAYNALQVRSDARDKTDIKDTELGLDFIERLRPVQFKWNVRDSYENFDNSSNENAGKRYHNGFIAQEVKEVMDELGVDFAGYQDHLINGGCDVKSLGYDEFIAPMVKAIQELSARVKELENK